MTQQTLYTVTVYSENQVGLLNQISIIFTRRQLNIESLSVSGSAIEGVHKFTITTYSDRETMEKLVKQIEKRIDVLRAFFYTDDEIIFQEVALYKVPTDKLLDDRSIEDLIRKHNARILVEGATVYSYNINDVSTLFPYRRTTIIIDGGECLVGEEGDRNVYVHTRNHSVVSLATDEIVLNVFWNKLIEKENLLSKGCSGADFLQAIHNLAERYGITDEMTKNFLVYNFQKEKTQNGKKR